MAINLNWALRIFCLLVFGGCATQTPDAPAPVAPASTTVASDTATPDQAPEATPHESVVQNVEPDIVCRTVKRTGSNIREKECFTREQEKQMSAESREFLRTRGARGEAYRPPDPHDPRKDK